MASLVLKDLLLESLTPRVNATFKKVQNIPDHILVKQSSQHGFQQCFPKKLWYSQCGCFMTWCA
jgi:hypothetical protein